MSRFQVAPELSEKHQQQNIDHFLLLNHGCNFRDVSAMSVKIRVFYCYKETQAIEWWVFLKDFLNKSIIAI